MRKIVLLLLLCFCTLPFIKAQYPTDSAQIYLITASPGEQTYAIFGHSALRVYDPLQGYDAVFNWGTFDFGTENFYLKFSTGKLMYFLSVSDYSDFLYAYQSNGQAIYLQELNLSNKEKFTLINNMQINLREENKYFRYDFFRDNCATRIRDIVANSVDGTLVFDSSYVTKPESIRKLFGKHLESQPWTYLGLNIIMGKSTDSIAGLTDYMYLPLHLKNMFATATVITADGEKKLTGAPVELFPTTIVAENPSFLTTPNTLFFLLFLGVLLFTIWEYRSKKYYKGVDVFLFMVTGLLGLLITWLWGWSLHIYVHNNLHIIWASPLNFIAAIGLIICSKLRWLPYYFGLYALSVVLLIMVSFFVVQEFYPATYFLMGMMIVRAVRLYMLK